MNVFTAPEILKNFAAAGEKKTKLSTGRLLALATLAGMFIALGGAVTNTASHSIANVSAARIISGLLFPGGLSLVILMGAELFTGNCLIVISVLEKRATLPGMLRNWALVYLGNFLGALLVSWGCAFFGQLNYSGGELAVFTMRLAASKLEIPVMDGIVRGFFCNVLVCLAVLCSLSSKDTAGRILGTVFPIAFFVICGFEHCIANMYYIPAGLFAAAVPGYASAAAAAGIDIASLSWGGFLAGNLLPVTLGNILGGVFTGLMLWLGHRETVPEPAGDRSERP